MLKNPFLKAVFDALEDEIDQTGAFDGILFFINSINDHEYIFL